MSSDIFIQLVKKEIVVEFIKEHEFHPTRKWRFDYACLEHKIAIEVEGGVWSGGRHTRGKGFLGDIEKYNEATSMGWRIIRVTPSELLRTNILRLIEKIIEYDSNN